MTATGRTVTVRVWQYTEHRFYFNGVSECISEESAVNLYRSVSVVILMLDVNLKNQNYKI